MTGRVISVPGEQAVVFVFTAGTLRDANIFGKEAGTGGNRPYRHRATRCETLP